MDTQQSTPPCNGMTIVGPDNSGTEYSATTKAEYVLVKLICETTSPTIFGVPSLTSPDGRFEYVTTYDKEIGPILVRDEYRLVFEELEKKYQQCKDPEYDRSAEIPQVITGQPSSGKTVFADLLRAKLISENRCVLYTRNGEWFFYESERLWSVDPTRVEGRDSEKLIRKYTPRIIYGARDMKNDAWQFHGPMGHTMLRRGFTSSTTPGFIVFHSSPIRRRWDADQFNVLPECWMMNPFTADEIESLAAKRHEYAEDADTPGWLYVTEEHFDELALRPGRTAKEIIQQHPQYHRLFTHAAKDIVQEFENWGPCPRYQLSKQTSFEYLEWKCAIEVLLVADEIHPYLPTGGPKLWVWQKLLYRQSFSYFEDRGRPASHEVFVLRREDDEDITNSNFITRIEGKQKIEVLRAVVADELSGNQSKLADVLERCGL